MEVYMLNKFLDENQDYFYFVFRVIVGFTFFLHGWMKVSNYMARNIAPGSLMFFAMLIEVIVGIFLIIGLFTRYSAGIAAIEMVVAYFKVHAPQAVSPLANKGEPALLFFAAFLVLVAFGARKWAVDNLKKP